MYLKMIKHILVSTLLAVSLTVGGCVTTTVGPNGQVQVTEPDYGMIQLMATASIAAWAASQKDGIKQQDAEALAALMGSIIDFHADGTPLDPAAWAVAITKQVPKRYQGLALILVQFTAHELDKYGVSAQALTKDSVGYKIFEAIIDGTRLGLQPYLKSSNTIWEDRTVFTYEA